MHRCPSINLCALNHAYLYCRRRLEGGKNKNKRTRRQQSTNTVNQNNAINKHTSWVGPSWSLNSEQWKFSLKMQFKVILTAFWKISEAWNLAVAWKVPPMTLDGNHRDVKGQWRHAADADCSTYHGTLNTAYLAESLTHCSYLSLLIVQTIGNHPLLTEMH